MNNTLLILLGVGILLFVLQKNKSVTGIVTVEPLLLTNKFYEWYAKNIGDYEVKDGVQVIPNEKEYYDLWYTQIYLKGKEGLTS